MNPPSHLMRTLPILLALAFFVGCDSSESGATDLTDRERAGLQAGEVQIPLGETATLDGLTIRFDEVIEDSRCPEDVACVWGGWGRVGLTIDGQADTLFVYLPETVDKDSVRIGDVTVFAVDLAPYPRADAPSDATPVVALSSVIDSE